MVGGMNIDDSIADEFMKPRGLDRISEGGEVEENSILIHEYVPKIALLRKTYEKTKRSPCAISF